MMFEPQFHTDTVHAARFSEAHFARAMLRRQALRLREEDRGRRRNVSDVSRTSPVHAMVDWLRAVGRR